MSEYSEKSMLIESLHDLEAKLAAALRERDGLVAAGKRIMAMHCGPPDGVGNWDAAFDQLEAALAAIRGMEGSQAASGSGKSDGGNG